VSCVTPYYAEAKTKEVALVSQYHAVVVDHDHDDLGIGSLQQIYAELKVPYLAYTTSSHTNEERRYRVIIPLAEPVGSDKYQELAAGIARFLGTDAAQARSQQVFFLPNKLSEESEYWSTLNKDFMPLSPNDLLHPFVAKAAAGWKLLLAESEQLERSEAAPLRARPQQMASGNASGVVEKFLQLYDVESQLHAAGYVSNGHGSYKCPTSQSGGFGVNILTRDGKQTCYSHHGSHDPLSSDNNGGHALDAFDVYVALSHGGDYSAAVAFIAPEIDPVGQQERQTAKAIELEEKAAVVINLHLAKVDPIVEVDHEAIRQLISAKKEIETSGELRKIQTDIGWLGKDYDPTEDYSWPLMRNGKPNPSGSRFETLEELTLYTTPWPEEQVYVSIAKMLMRKVEAIDMSTCLFVGAAVVASLLGRSVVGGFIERDPAVTVLELLLIAETGMGKTTLGQQIKKILTNVNPSENLGTNFVELNPVSKQGIYGALSPYAQKVRPIFVFTDEAAPLLEETSDGNKADMKAYALSVFDGAFTGVLPGIAAAGMNNRLAVPGFHSTTLRCTTPGIFSSVFGDNAETGATNRSVVLLIKSIVVGLRKPPVYTGTMEERIAALDKYEALFAQLNNTPDWFYDRLRRLSEGKFGEFTATPDRPLRVKLEGTREELLSDRKPFSHIVESVSGDNKLFARLKLHLSGIIAAVTAADTDSVGTDGIAYPTRETVLFWTRQLEIAKSRLTEESGEVSLALSSGSAAKDWFVKRIQTLIDEGPDAAMRAKKIPVEHWKYHIVSLTSLKSCKGATASKHHAFKNSRDPNGDTNRAVDELANEGAVLRRLSPAEIIEHKISTSETKKASFFKINIDYFI
jgi:hypothetical protein